MKVAIGEEELELEAMRKEDRSWHPCRVSLSESDPALLSVSICSKNADEEYDIASKDEVLSYLRYRSVPLQNGECSNIEEGDHVLAVNKNQSKPLSYDAVVEKVQRVKHSQRVYCRCTFEVKWLHLESEKESVVLSSNLITKLSRKSIDNHSVVADFLNSLKSANCTSDVEVRTPEADVQGLPEYDLEGLLERQIEEITRIVDSTSQTSIDEILTCHSKDVNVIASSKAWQTRDCTRVQTENQTILDVKEQMEEQTSLIPLDVEKKENANFLSPLAARAALASLMHDLPISSEFPYCSAKEESPLVQSSCEHVSTGNFFKDFSSAKIPEASESKDNMMQRQNISGSFHKSEPKRNRNCHKSTVGNSQSPATMDNCDSIEEVGRKINGQNHVAKMRLTRSMADKANGDGLEKICSKHCDKNSDAEQPTDCILLEKIRNKKGTFFPASVSHGKTRKHLIEDGPLGESARGHTNLVDAETSGDLVETSGSDDLSIKGTKRTRLGKHNPNNRIREVESKGHHESSKKPGSRFSPRLKLLQRNDSLK